MVAIGLDLGSTHACVGVWHNGKMTIIANDQGFRATPCFVSYEEEEVIVGDTAVNKLHSNASSTVYHLKRLLGKKLEQVANESFVKDWTFDVVADEDNMACAQILKNGEPTKVTPVEFCTLLIQNLLNLAQDYTGEQVECVVLSIPAHFGEEEKEFMRQAAKQAGVTEMKFIVEPLAAAIAYGLDDAEAVPKPEYAVVFDIGGATHDVTLLSIDKGLMEVVETTGKASLGGEDFTRVLFDYCAKTFQRRTKLDVTQNQKASTRLRIACEQAKRSLSTQTQVNIEVDSMMEGEDFTLKLSRLRFEELINDFVSHALEEVEALLEKADLDKDQVDHVILIGGSSRIPLVQKSVKEFFENAKAHLQISPDEAVAHGATVESSCMLELLGLADAEPMARGDVVNVVPLTLSVALGNGSVSEVLHRDTILPATAQETFTTSVDNQTEALLEVYEGERVMKKDNVLLARLKLDGLTPKPKGELEIVVEFNVSSKGVLSINAFEKSKETDTRKSLSLTQDPKRLTSEQVDTLIKQAEDAAEEDDAHLDELERLQEEEEAEEEEAEEETVAKTTAAPAVELD